MRKRLWVALAAQLILASSCSTQDIPDAGSGSVRPPGTPSPPPTGPGTPASTPPHEREIAAANHHGLGFTVTPDTTPPSPVTDLAFANLLPTEVNVQWTASGDDGAIGTAASYDLRWSTSPITPENFAAATPIPTGTPQPPGTVETAAFIVPPQSPVFVALVVADEESNVSPLSNVISGTTPAGEQVFVETVEGDTSKWTAKGLWHVTTRRAADGSHAFWYGRESTGTYDTPDLSNDGDAARQAGTAAASRKQPTAAAWPARCARTACAARARRSRPPAIRARVRSARPIPTAATTRGISAASTSRRRPAD